MDAEVVTLAASGATTLVSLMATDAWGKAKELVQKAFSRSEKGAAEELLAELGSARGDLALPRGAEQSAEGLAEVWKRLLIESVADGSISAEQLASLTDDLASLATGSTPANGGGISMSASAQNGGKVFQQGFGIQINS